MKNDSVDWFDWGSSPDESEDDMEEET